MFKNPIYNNVQLTVNGKNLLDEPVSTQGARFLQYQLIASDLEGQIQAGYCYDGYDSNGQNVAVQIKGQSIYTDDNDTYWNFNNDSGTNPPPPQIWCCRDTYFLASVNGLQCFGCDYPPNSQDA